MAQKTYHFKLLLKKKQHKWLKATTDHLCELYNSALEHRILAYAKGVRITKYDQDRELTELRKDSEYTKWSVATQRGALVRLDEVFKEEIVLPALQCGMEAAMVSTRPARSPTRSSWVRTSPIRN